MAQNFNSNTENKDEWLTPPKIIKALGEFDLDPCSPIKRPWDTARKHYSLKDGDGLILPWRGRVWCNPPYGKYTFDWLERLSRHQGGGYRSCVRTHRNERLPSRSLGESERRIFLRGTTQIFPRHGRARRHGQRTVMSRGLWS